MESCLPIASCDAQLLDMMRVLRHPFLHGLGFFFEHKFASKSSPAWKVSFWKAGCSIGVEFAYFLLFLWELLELPELVEPPEPP